MFQVLLYHVIIYVKWTAAGDSGVNGGIAKGPQRVAVELEFGYASAITLVQCMEGAAVLAHQKNSPPATRIAVQVIFQQWIVPFRKI